MQPSCVPLDVLNANATEQWKASGRAPKHFSVSRLASKLFRRDRIGCRAAARPQAPTSPQRGALPGDKAPFGGDPSRDGALLVGNRRARRTSETEQSETAQRKCPRLGRP